MTQRILSWLRLSSCPKDSLEYRVSQLIREIGVSGVAERCNVSTREVLVWVQLRAVPAEHAESLAADAPQRHPIDSLVPRYRELRAQGMRISEIADTLGVSKQAVSKGLKSNERG